MKAKPCVESSPELGLVDACPCTSPCPMDLAFKVIGGKWKIRILCVLFYEDSIRYSQIKRKVTGITGTMLANSLRELEEVGIVNRVQYDEMPVRVEYSVTEAGRTLIPILLSLRNWCARYRVDLIGMGVLED